MNEKIRLQMLGELIELFHKESEAAANSDPVRPYDVHFRDVEFLTARGRVIGSLGLTHALDCLWNNVWHFEDFDLDEARKLRIVCL